MTTPDTEDQGGEPSTERMDRRGRRLRRILTAVIAALGLPFGVTWAAVAPGQEFRVLADGRYSGLPTADYHGFDATALFVLGAVAVGLIVAVAAWRIRSIRGVATLIALAVSTTVSGVVAFLIALIPLYGTDPATVGATGHDLLVTAPPTLPTPLVIVAAPLAAVLTYTFLVAWNGRPDLGRLQRPDDALS